LLCHFIDGHHFVSYKLDIANISTI
jgi:hypothetical protein